MPGMTLASTVLMVRPACFAFSEEAAASNLFQRRLDVPAHRLAALAVEEFDRMVVQLREEGITVRVVEDTPDPPKPDAVFPNNWVSWMPDGRAIVYPMAVPSRRAEKRRDILPDRVVDWSMLEDRGLFVEGTGSLVFDHENRLAYACRSPRTVDMATWIVATKLGYTSSGFDARLDGAAVYHTNVVLGLGVDWAVWFGDGATRGRHAVEGRLQDTGRRLISLTAAQVRAYCGNVLTLRGAHGPVTVLSRTAWEAFRPEQRDQLGRVVIVAIPTIETVGGGSARCMMAEVF